MKNLLNILIALSILGVFTAGTNDSDPDKKGKPIQKLTLNEPYCVLRNFSGHTISIVQSPACAHIPDSLVLLNGTEYSFFKWAEERPKLSFFFSGSQAYTTRKIYYDGRYMLDFDYVGGDDRKFYHAENYSTVPSNLLIFTFTESDYLHAVKYGKDLGVQP